MYEEILSSRAFVRDSCGGRLAMEARAAAVAADGGTARKFDARGPKRTISEIFSRSILNKGAESAEVESRW